MSDQDGNHSPSPSPSPCCSMESSAETLSCRGSRAESEVPHRSHLPKSDRQSRVRDEQLQRKRGGKCLESCSLYKSQVQENEVTGLNEPKGGETKLRKDRPRHHNNRGKRGARRDGGSNREGKLPTKGTAAVTATASGSGGRNVESPEWSKDVADSDNNSSYLSRGGGNGFKLFQKLCHPFSTQDVMPKWGPCSHKPEATDSAELEAIGDFMVTNSGDAGGMRSVLRKVANTIPSRVNSMALSVLPNFATGSSLIAIGVGDANGRVNYCEIPVGDAKLSRPSLSSQRKSESVVTTASQCRTDMDVSSISTSIPSVSPRQQLDTFGFQQQSVRKHTHQAYVEELDCLTSVPISQSVNCFQFLRPHLSPSMVSYLTSNDRVIKLFRVQREGLSMFHAFPEMESIVGPELSKTKYFPCATLPSLILPARVYSGNHINRIHGLSVCADDQSFLSVDDLEVFWWNFECADGSNGSRIADMRPPSGNMDDVVELFTTAGFHPTHNSLFFVGRNSGFLGIGDLREAATGAQRRYSTYVRGRVGAGWNSRLQDYGEILCSVSAAGFIGTDHILTRDYFSLKLWDLRRTSEPCDMVRLMPYVEPYLRSLYESDAIFDRFSAAVDHVSGTIITGLYDGAVAAWQPFHSGRPGGEEILTFYRADPLALLCEVENGGRVTAETLQASFSRRLGVYCSTHSECGQFHQTHLPEPIANRVTCVSISEGGDRFAMSLRDGRGVFLFER
ncbi:hypothetical protein DPX39_110127400 [Trypanosoma brucei equiperdum]|uniref:Serine/threonine-protein phosphatase 2A 55 kDa regulatory subunit B n=1 Tax=Trypanosoma brucei equiperdum TaxID=630700 RepID=A0A3L6KVT2_9TRYP|nr:hypothetical protein DPX39_110127400 [Trypanosoma brucei equiperdum]